MRFQRRIAGRGRIGLPIRSLTKDFATVIAVRQGEFALVNFRINGAAKILIPSEGADPRSTRSNALGCSGLRSRSNDEQTVRALPVAALATLFVGNWGFRARPIQRVATRMMLSSAESAKRMPNMSSQ
jgi:hypothetical protein